MCKGRGKVTDTRKTGKGRDKVTDTRKTGKGRGKVTDTRKTEKVVVRLQIQGSQDKGRGKARETRKPGQRSRTDQRSTCMLAKSTSAAGLVNSLKPHWVSLTPRTHRSHTSRWKAFMRTVRNSDL